MSQDNKQQQFGQNQQSKQNKQSSQMPQHGSTEARDTGKQMEQKDAKQDQSVVDEGGE